MSNHFGMEDDSGVSFAQCIGTCSHRNGRAIGCHAMCGNYVPSTLRTSFLKVLAYQYEPSPAEITTRVGWIYSQWASGPIWKHLKPYLPQELRLHVAGHLPLQGTILHRYAAAHTYSMLPKNIKCGNSRIRISAGIWASFTNFEGGWYISSLSNTRDEYHTDPVFTPNPSHSVDTIYIAENYLGVVRVLFCSSVQTPTMERRQGLWWRIVRLCGREPKLIIQTDVSYYAFAPHQLQHLTGHRVSSSANSSQKIRVALGIVTLYGPFLP